MKDLLSILPVFLMVAIAAAACDKETEENQNKKEKDPRELVEQSVGDHDTIPPFTISIPQGIVEDRKANRKQSVEWDGDKLRVSINYWSTMEAREPARKGFCKPKYAKLKQFEQQGDRSTAVCESSAWTSYTVADVVDGRFISCKASDADNDLAYIKSICDSFEFK